ncbi:hypothetical protein SELMODRAFT_104174 [Selaginella moellendorffii]|uniref:Uncharacterized protein GRXc3-2 n=1 Tax=Selaginella moellendorffii TaxID=88036 RepID=D8RXZ2_SELML|nr:hypothetical protein SELMODRAFT_104174 [Selaginella moellendorffii]
MALSKAKDIVAHNPLVVFSKTYCPFCVKVKELFSSIGAQPKVVELDSEADGADLQAALAEWTGQRSVPSVFVGGKHVGGCDGT